MPAVRLSPPAPALSPAAARPFNPRLVAALGLSSVMVALVFSDLSWGAAEGSASGMPAADIAVPASNVVDRSAPGSAPQVATPAAAGLDPAADRPVTAPTAVESPATTAAALSAPADRGFWPRNTPVATAAPANERGGVESVLAQYRGAFNALDANKIRGFWPTVNTPVVARAFNQLKNQELTFDRCAMDISAVTAVATCRGRAAYTPRAGSGTPRVERRRWTFRLEKLSGTWIISRVDSTRGN